VRRALHPVHVIPSHYGVVSELLARPGELGRLRNVLAPMAPKTIQGPTNKQRSSEQSRHPCLSHATTTLTRPNTDREQGARERRQFPQEHLHDAQQIDLDFDGGEGSPRV